MQPVSLKSHRLSRTLVFALALIGGSGVSACAQQPPGRQQQSSNPLATILEGPRLTTTPLEAPDWVTRSRTGREQNFVPVGPPPNQPQRAVLTPAQVRAKEAELDAVRSRHDQLAGRKGFRGQIGTASAEPIKREKKKPAPCVLTCDTGLGTTTRK